MSIKDAIGRRVVIGATTLSLLGIAGAGTVMVTQGAFAQTPGPSTTPNAKPKSNEDATHEANESPEHEAAEDNGTFTHGKGGGHGSNEDATHEANETPEHEAAEDAHQAPGAPGGQTAPTGQRFSGTHSSDSAQQ